MIDHTPEAVVARLGAVQAQDFTGAKWSVGRRLRGVVESDLDRAFTDGTILRTHVLRPTWHLVAPADIRWMLDLTAPRVHGINGTYYRKLELDAAIRGRAAELFARALEGGRACTRDELRAVLEEDGISTAEDFRLVYLLMSAELDGVLCSGPRVGNQFTYMRLDERAPAARVLPREEALAELADRYFTSRGPATDADFARWSGLTITDARQGRGSIAERLTSGAYDGQTYWWAETAGHPLPPAPALLLSVYDEYVAGYKDRGAIVDPLDNERLVRMGNALTHIIVLDTRIAGTWRRVIDKHSVVIEQNLFRDLTGVEVEALAHAAQMVSAFFERSVILR